MGRIHIGPQNAPLATAVPQMFSVGSDAVIAEPQIIYVDRPVETVVEREVIRHVEVPVERIVEKEIIREVPVHVDREVIKTVYEIKRVEVPVEKIVRVHDIEQLIAQRKLVYEKERSMKKLQVAFFISAFINLGLILIMVGR